MADVRLGIDYGTSNTVAVLQREEGPSRALLFDGTPLLPSAVFAGDVGLLVGRDAERAARTDPARFEGNPKQRIDELEVLLGKEVHEVTALIAAVLDRVVGEAQRVVGRPVPAITITHPVSWGPARRKVLLDAARRAGLAVPVLVPEPVAAAAYFTAVLRNEVAVGQSLVVYDLGAGTFDVSVVSRTESGFETLAYRGLEDVGGLDLDELVVRHVGEQLATSAPEAWRRLSDPATAQDRRHRMQLWQDAREAREALSRAPSATLFIPSADQDVLITRQEFEQAATALLQTTVDTAMAAVREARVRSETLAGWFLVGGATRTPLIATMLLRATRQAPTILEEPQLVVADGAVHVTAGSIDTAVSRPSTPASTPTPTMPQQPAPPQLTPVVAPSQQPAPVVRPPAASPYPATPTSYAPPPPASPPRPVLPAYVPSRVVPRQTPAALSPRAAEVDDDPATAEQRRRNAPLGRRPRELAAIAFGCVALISTTIAFPLMGAALLPVLGYRLYRLSRSGRGWIDAPTAALLIAVPGLAGLGSGNVYLAGLSLFGPVAGLLWLRRMVDDRAD
ncbi:Hsp70 family protein [Dactylosporangium sp. CS-047395]|uniref:Hsp70 family protein n=1 Tax=Dactylosporangium sp. CS-047395 TaxID=3239936 RepID=UPI003D8B210B